LKYILPYGIIVERMLDSSADSRFMNY